jgi:hypothetical protein
MLPTRRPHFNVQFLARLVLAWFALSLGVAIASPIVNPQAMELVCSASGAVKVVVHTDDGAQGLGSMHMDCPLCMLAGAPPPLPVVAAIVLPLPLGRAVQSIPAARIAAATAAPPPARAPPTFS